MAANQIDIFGTISPVNSPLERQHSSASGESIDSMGKTIHFIECFECFGDDSRIPTQCSVL